MQRWLHHPQKVEHSIHVLAFNQDHAVLREVSIRLHELNFLEWDLDTQSGVFKVVLAIFLLADEPNDPLSVLWAKHWMHVVDYFVFWVCLWLCQFGFHVHVCVWQYSLLSLRKSLREVFHPGWIHILNSQVVWIVLKAQAWPYFLRAYYRSRELCELRYVNRFLHYLI